MTDLAGAEFFRRLFEDDKSRYIQSNRQMVGFERG